MISDMKKKITLFKLPNFIVRRTSYKKIMEINREINEITKEYPYGYDVRAVGRLEKTKSLYIKMYNDTLPKPK